MSNNIDISNHSFSGERGERFMKLYTATQRRLYAYIVSLIADSSAVDDIIQETVTHMWKQFDEFEPGTDFAAWALSIAKFKIFNHIKDQQKKKRYFSSNTIQAIEEVAKEKSKKTDERLDALRKCIEKLSANDRQLLTLRYEIGASLKSVSQRVELSVNTLYSRLYRIRLALVSCVQKNMKKERG
jgi:RNA polymerase sigma-70 factor (ECF subfamily)